MVLARETQPTLVAEGVVRLGTELVNWYLLEEDGKVTVVDAGAPAYRPQLDKGLALLGRQPALDQACAVQQAGGRANADRRCCDDGDRNAIVFQSQQQSVEHAAIR